METTKFSNRAEKKKFSYENKVKPGSIQNIVLSNTLQTTVKRSGRTKNIIIKNIGNLKIKSFLKKDLNIIKSLKENNPANAGLF